MTEEVKGAITSDKVETDNTNFATVKADQTCEEVLLPRENAFRQLTWQVTLEKGSVYNPQENIGIYAEEVDCKYGVQISGDVFGRNEVSVEHGGAAHGDENIGARIFGSVVSEGQVEIAEPASKLDDWEPSPVSVYGDVVGNHVTFDEPTIVYGNVKAESTFRVNAPTVVIGEVRSGGLIEASDLFAFTITGHDNLTLGTNVAVVNPQIRSDGGRIAIADRVGILTPSVFGEIQSNNDINAVGTWIFDVDIIWEHNVLLPDDVSEHGDGEIAKRSWRTVEEFDETYYEEIRTMRVEMIEATRRNPPAIEELRYGGITSVDDLGGVTVEGDLVKGTQQKHVKQTDVTEIDQSTTVEDSVLKDTDVSGGEQNQSTSEEE